MHTALATLLKSKKPLPVPVIAQAIAKMVMRTKAILITFRMTPFFMQSHSFIKFKFSVPYKINLLGFTKSPNNDLLIYFNIKYKWFVEMKYIVFNFHTKKL
jgi:hypothetical protein